MSFNMGDNPLRSSNCNDLKRVIRPSWSFVEVINGHVNWNPFGINLKPNPKADKGLKPVTDLSLRKEI